MRQHTLCYRVALMGLMAASASIHGRGWGHVHHLEKGKPYTS